MDTLKFRSSPARYKTATVPTFLTLLAAALTFASVAVAAPSQPDTKSDCGSCSDHGHHDGGDDHKWGNGQKVRVGFSLDLNPNTPLGSLSCSATFAKNFPQFHTLSDLPTAPFYGEAPGAVDGSPKCGSCFKLQYDGNAPIYMIAVDNAAMFQLGKAGFEKFAGAEGFAKGSVDATAVEVSPEFCHLPKKW